MEIQSFVTEGVVFTCEMNKQEKEYGLPFLFIFEFIRKHFYLSDFGCLRIFWKSFAE